MNRVKVFFQNLYDWYQGRVAEYPLATAILSGIGGFLAGAIFF